MHHCTTIAPYRRVEVGQQAWPVHQLQHAESCIDGACPRRCRPAAAHTSPAASRCTPARPLRASPRSQPCHAAGRRAAACQVDESVILDLAGSSLSRPLHGAPQPGAQAACATPGTASSARAAAAAAWRSSVPHYMCGVPVARGRGTNDIQPAAAPVHTCSAAAPRTSRRPSCNLKPMTICDAGGRAEALLGTNRASTMRRRPRPHLRLEALVQRLAFALARAPSAPQGPRVADARPEAVSRAACQLAPSAQPPRSSSCSSGQAHLSVVEALRRGTWGPCRAGCRAGGRGRPAGSSRARRRAHQVAAACCTQDQDQDVERAWVPPCSSLGSPALDGGERRWRAAACSRTQGLLLCLELARWVSTPSCH
jgi:hypothetical protein